MGPHKRQSQPLHKEKGTRLHLKGGQKTPRNRSVIRRGVNRKIVSKGGESSEGDDLVGWRTSWLHTKSVRKGGARKGYFDQKNRNDFSRCDWYRRGRLSSSRGGGRQTLRMGERTFTRVGGIRTQRYALREALKQGKLRDLRAETGVTQPNMANRTSTQDTAILKNFDGAKLKGLVKRSFPGVL